jgi:hypothetical protein
VTSLELRLLAQELWRADPDLEIRSLNPRLYPISEIECFPVTEEHYKEFFKQAVIQVEGQRKYVIGFLISSDFELHELKLQNGKALEKLLKERQSWLVIHRFDSLLTEQIGWFACKFVGANCRRVEQELNPLLLQTIATLNQTRQFEGAKAISGSLQYEVIRSTVYESRGNDECAAVLAIRCESHNVEWMKTILVHTELEVSKFGTFMLKTTNRSNQELHWTMYKKHVAFSQDVWTIVVGGLHDNVLKEVLGTEPGQSVHDILLQTRREDIKPIKSIEYTTRSENEGHFLFITSRECAEATESIIANELTLLARQTTAHYRHFTDNTNYSKGIRQVTRRPSRLERTKREFGQDIPT